MPSSHEPDPQPTPIEYKRWKHKERAYLVEVFQVLNFRGKHGCHTVVVVERKGERNVSWPAKTFLKLFEPYGRRLRRKSRWDRLREA